MNPGLQDKSMRAAAGRARAHGRAGPRVNAIDPGLSLDGGSAPGAA
jgi:hypothetical protein